MKQKLNGSNKTKSESFGVHQSQFENASRVFCKPFLWQSMLTPTMPEIKESLRAFHKRLNTTQASLEEFWRNVTDIWPNSQKVSVYESLIERVAYTEKYVAEVIDMLDDLRELIDILQGAISKVMQLVAEQSAEHNKSLELIKEELKKNEKEMKSLREDQAILAKEKARQYDMLMLIFGFQLITLVVCVVLSCCHKPVYIEAKAGSETRILNAKYEYIGRMKKRCFSINEY